MTGGFIALGTLSIIYYTFLVWYTKKWNGTFMPFWLGFGIVNIVIAIFIEKTPSWFQYIFVGMISVFWMLFIFVEILILCAMVAVVPKNLDYIIILGAQIRGTKVTESLKRRLDRGVRYLQDNSKTIAIVSGGRGKDEDTTEAAAMAEYMRNCGVEKDRIWLEESSCSTYQNLKNSRKFIVDVECEKIGIVTNNFHIYRAMKYAGVLGYRNKFAIVASSNVAVFLNYMVREFFAVIAMVLRLKKSKKSLWL